MKKTLFLALLCTTTFLTPVAAAEIDAETRIDAVTVYPRGAEVTRIADVQIAAGTHALVLDDLPEDIDPQSIRVEGKTGAKVEIGSVDSKLVMVAEGEGNPGERQSIEHRILKLKDERSALAQLVTSIAYQRKLLQQMAQRPLNVPDPKSTVASVDVDSLAKMFDLVTVRLQALDERQHKTSIRTRWINEKISALKAKLAELAPRRVRKAMVRVDLSAAHSTEGSFRIRYRIQNAGWRPFYDARLKLPSGEGAAELSLVRRAEIAQSSTENWQNVAMTLSTARATGATAAPELAPEIIDFWAGIRAKTAAKLNQSVARPQSLTDDRLEVSEQDAAPRKAEERNASVSVAGFQALYSIPGRVSVGNEGTAKKVRISSNTLDASLNVRAVPMLDPNAYLTANFKLGGETPLLPGRVLLFRDGVYLGEGGIPLLSPGQSHRLGFGIDDRVRIRRTKVHGETSEAGILTTDVVKEQSWTIEIENLHSRTMPVTVYDRLPVAAHEDISVKLLRGSTPPSELNVEKKRGVLAWSYDLRAGQKRQINFGYRVSSPKDKPLRVSGM